jgi:hypothetical protein
MARRARLIAPMPDSTPPVPATFELAFSNAALPPNDPRWRTQVDNLLTDLKRGGGDVRRELTAVAGTKGGMETIILALGTSGAVTAAVTAFRLWLARPGKRSATVTYTDQDGKTVTEVITAENVSEAVFLKLVEGARKRR